MHVTGEYIYAVHLNDAEYAALQHNLDVLLQDYPDAESPFLRDMVVTLADGV